MYIITLFVSRAIIISSASNDKRMYLRYDNMQSLYRIHGALSYAYHARSYRRSQKATH
jgi:hypothetical protein